MPTDTFPPRTAYTLLALTVAGLTAAPALALPRDTVIDVCGCPPGETMSGSCPDNFSCAPDPTPSGDPIGHEGEPPGPKGPGEPPGPKGTPGKNATDRQERAEQCRAEELACEMAALTELDACLESGREFSRIVCNAESPLTSHSTGGITPWGHTVAQMKNGAKTGETYWDDVASWDYACVDGDPGKGCFGPAFSNCMESWGADHPQRSVQNSSSFSLSLSAAYTVSLGAQLSAGYQVTATMDAQKGFNGACAEGFAKLRSVCRRARLACNKN